MKLAMIGPFPPPVHGSSKNFLSIFNEIKDDVNVIKFDTSPKNIQKGVLYHFYKLKKVFSSCIKLLFSSVDKGYITVDAGLGMFYSILFISILRIKKTRVIIHHRSFAYIDRYSKLMKILLILGCKDTTHIFLGQSMASSFIQRYQVVVNFLVVSNAKQVTPIPEVTQLEEKTLKIGYLSNLSFEKGFPTALDVFNQVRSMGCDVNFIIAGPPSDLRTKKILDKAVDKYPNQIKYKGAVYGDEKDDFFESIDIFLFPTNYVNEAQPNVLFEALSHGVPVISTCKGCIPDDIKNEYGLVVPFNEYVQQATTMILELSLDRAKLNEYKKNALLAINTLKSDALMGHSKLISLLIEND